MYQPIFSNQDNLLQAINQQNVAGISYAQSTEDADITIIIRLEMDLLGFKYQKSTGIWLKLWHKQIFNIKNDYPLEKYPWLLVDNLLPDNQLIVLRHTDGIRFYQLSASSKQNIEPKLLKEDGNFHEVYDQTILIGNFYTNSNWLGFITRNSAKEIQFYAATQDSFLPDEPDPLFIINKEIALSSTWQADNLKFYLTKLNYNGPTAIGLFNKLGLEFYQFNEDFQLNNIASSKRIFRTVQANEHLFFANLTNQAYQDILQLNDSGLFLYQFNSQEKDYEFLHHNTEFAKIHGWLPSYSESIKLFDLNNDGHEDLLFTGPGGLTALKYNINDKIWQHLLNIDHLSSKQRYGKIVGTLPAISPLILKPSIFVQNTAGQLEWAKINNYEEAIIKEEQIRNLTTTKPSIFDNDFDYYPLEHALMPQKIPRKSLNEKPIFHWATQWQALFLQQEPVDISSGQVTFNVPLLHESLGFPLALFYHSQAKKSDLLGLGWSIPLAQDYIFVDHKGSIFIEDTSYYLVLQGRLQLLKLMSRDGSKSRFEFAYQPNNNPDLTIEYDQLTEVWLIENSVEQVIYGNSAENSVANALQWSLAWPYWRGSARDASQLKPLVIAWYLNTRFTKHKQQKLFYQYETTKATLLKTEKTYTTNIRLKAIKDNKQEMHLNFFYASKTSTEYTTHYPNDHEGNINFPIELTRQYYLKKINVVTANYQQSLELNYKLQDGQRFLTGLQQGKELVLQFNYDSSLLINYILPNGLNYSFDYEPITPPLGPTHKFSVREKSSLKTAFGPTYALMTFRSGLNEIILRIMNREMTRTLIDCAIDERLICPKVKTEIKHYIPQAYKNIFMIYIESAENKIFYIYNNLNETWLSPPKILSFNKNSLVRFSETIIAVSEPDIKQLKLFKSADNQPHWQESKFEMPKLITRLALHQQMVISYDDEQLWCFSLNEQQQWQRDVLANKLGDMKVILNSFDLTAETKNLLLTNLNQNGLQILNNFISLNSLHQQNNQLYNKIHLFLLNEEHKVAVSKTFEIPQEKILTITFELKQDKSIYRLGYVKEGNIFKLKVQTIAGEIIKDIAKISNMNRRQDAMEARLEAINKAENFQLFFKTNTLINWSLYFTQISQQGIFLGNSTLLRTMGNIWELESLDNKKTVNLGEKFFLELSGNNGQYIKLYKKNKTQHKLLKEITTQQNYFINRYPFYLAYQSQDNTAVEVLTFEDEQTLGETYSFKQEQLLLESNWQNLLTVANVSSIQKIHAEPYDFLVRPLATIINAKSKKPTFFVKKAKISDGTVERITGYEHKFSYEQEKLLYTETVTLIPGANKTLHGWLEKKRNYHLKTGNITVTEQGFDNEGQIIKSTIQEEKAQPMKANALNVSNESMTLMDISNQLLISDFSPYALADEMSAYYGFETYERRDIGQSNKKKWHFNEADVVKGHFAFTGEHYLRLNTTTSFLEGVFEPKVHHIKYVASCWLRYPMPLTLNTPVSFLKAKISTTNGVEFLGLLAEFKQQLGDWSYLELPIDFEIIKQIYENYSLAKKITTAVHDTKFKITLRVEVERNQSIELDHIRFSPVNHDFRAFVYNSQTGKQTATILANGLIARTIYNRINEEIASFQDNGHMEYFISRSKNSTSLTSRLYFQAENGFYEHFDLYTLRNHWHLNDPSAWQIAPGQLWHLPAKKQSLTLKTNLFHNTSAALRFYFALQTTNAALLLNWSDVCGLKILRQSNSQMTLTLSDKEIISQLPISAELIVMLEDNNIWLWLDGVLILEQVLQQNTKCENMLNPWSNFKLEAQGELLIEDFIIMNQPRLEIEYFNAFNEKIQDIQLESKQTALVTETIYDELGRQAIVTKTTRIQRQPTQMSILAYRAHFVINKNPKNPQTVWHTGVLRGEVDQLNPNDGGFAYSSSKYAANFLNEKIIIGLAGQNYAVDGPYATKLSQNTDIAFLNNLFPKNHGYRQQAVIKPNGSYKVSIFDQLDNQVAVYVRVPSYNHFLSTYEYDANKRLVKILPPLYHEKINTASKVTSWKIAEQQLTLEEKQLQQVLGTHFSYDTQGNLIRKTTADSGAVAYLYNKANQLIFMISLDSNNQTTNIVYFDYDQNGQLSSTGHLEENFSIDILKQYAERQNYVSLESVKPYQLFDYTSNSNFDGYIKHCITFNQHLPVADVIHFNKQQKLNAKSTLPITVQNEARTTEIAYNIKKYYTKAGDLQTLEYPFDYKGQTLRLLHHYDKLGQLISLSTSDGENLFNFSYHASGQLASEQYLPSSVYNFTRTYQYNSPGFLQQLSDPFLTENIAYTNEGYGQNGFGDGMIMQTVFNASWPLKADSRWFQIQLEADALASNYTKICIKALKQAGYIDNYNRPIKLFQRKMETALPLKCGGGLAQQLSHVLAKKRTPNYYGHRFAYGNHQELVKAKYFTEDTKDQIEPLQPNSFAKKLPNLTAQQSVDIWQLLAKAGYIIIDQQRHDFATAIGKEGKTFFNDRELIENLKSLNPNFTIYAEPIKRLVLKTISENQSLSLNDFKATFLKWQNIDATTNKLEHNQQAAVAVEIGQMLLAKGFFSTAAIDKEFKTILGTYNEFIPAIVKVLVQHFAYALGETAFDFESYEIDANGNHHKFYDGFRRYELNYRNNTNQIEAIKIDSKIFPIQHDDRGNIVQALHAGIAYIEYQPVSQRTTRIKLVDGRNLRFYYDAQGERILKQVWNAEGQLSAETHYLRDEEGRVLVDRQVKYMDVTMEREEIKTAYLYGTRGIIGFIRNNIFHSVITDHAGSVRLVIRSDQVVAAYDYLPYGKLMRSYGNNAKMHINYLFTGQEYDEETGLYNFHARLYDPSIGRFYQPDPKSQYFSPYVYAGNSPISLVDPDGEFAFIIMSILACAMVGAYFGGAAANNRWSPADWDWKDSGTYMGIIGGGIAGGLLPVGFVASVGVIGAGATIGLGLGGAYVMTATANGNLNPFKWKWDRPLTWSAGFQGFGIGSGLFGGVGMAHNFANRIFGAGSTGKVLFLGASYTTAGGLAYGSAVIANDGKAAFWQWDFKNPATYAALMNGFDMGMGWPQGFAEIARGFTKIVKNPQKLGGLLGKMTTSKKQALLNILKNPKNPLYQTAGGIVMAYFMGSSANGELDITRWNLADLSTYEAVLNGVFFGKLTTSMWKLAIKSKLKQTTALKLELSLKLKTKRQFRDWKSQIKSFSLNIFEIAYQRLMKQAFQQKTLWILKLERFNKNSFSKKDVESFFRNGFEAWRKGKNKPPVALQQLIRREATQTPAKELATWQAKAEQRHQKERTIYPDRDAEYLGCHKLRRRKRQTNFNKNCFVPVPPDEQPQPGPSWFQPLLEIPDRGNSLNKRLEFFADNGKTKFKLGEESCTIDEILDIFQTDGSYTPLNRKVQLSTTADIKQHFDKVGIGIDVAYQKTGQVTKPITVYTFEQNNPKHRSAISELVAYNKENRIKDSYIIKDEESAIRVSNPKRNDVYFEPAKLDGVGTELNPYTFTNKIVNYKDLEKARQNKNSEFHKLAVHLERHINIAERGRSDLGGILKMIGGENGGLQAPKGGTSYMKELEARNYVKPVRNHKDGNTVGDIFSKQLTKFINERLPDYQQVVSSFSLPGLVNYILKLERPTTRYSTYMRGHGSRRRRSLQTYTLKSKIFADDLATALRAPCSNLNITQLVDKDFKETHYNEHCIEQPHYNKQPHNNEQLQYNEQSRYNVQPIYTEQPRTTYKPQNGPTLLKMGKYWFNNFDMTGNLTWAILLARKWTGYRPKVSLISSVNTEAFNIFDVQAKNLVDIFKGIVLNHAVACGIAAPLIQHVLFKEGSLHSVISDISKKLATDQLIILPKLLNKKLIQQNMDHLAFVTTPKQAKKLFARIIKDMPKLQQIFEHEVQDWQSTNEMKANINFISKKSDKKFLMHSQKGLDHHVVNSKNTSEFYTQLLN